MCFCSRYVRPPDPSEELEEEEEEDHDEEEIYKTQINGISDGIVSCRSASQLISAFFPLL